MPKGVAVKLVTSKSIAPSGATLSMHEKRILRLLCDGLTNKEIATCAGFSPEYVKASLGRVFHKIRIAQRTRGRRRAAGDGVSSRESR
jgi:DNA-binding CsgD family transcriptional regulator